MNKIGLAAVLCAIGVAACMHLREPSDAQLATLLLGERANPADANAPLDTNAIDCLRAWSGDKELAKGLPVRIAGEDGMKSCRGKLDTWVADATRNPDKFRFDDVSAPKTVRRAMALQEARRLSAAANPAAREVPAALARPAAPPAALATPDPTVDLGVAGSRLQEAETLCQQTQQAAAKKDANAGLKSFAEFCAGNLSKLRATMEQSAHSGQGSERLDAIAASADNIANVARSVLAAGN
ncbi:hypothetical protein [Dokdonella soli]|uniref:Lipoprotein n=1 Tax=Dokdonella soli TaxID=529810 RepID=A0ABP3TKQ9_9GAMM